MKTHKYYVQHPDSGEYYAVMATDEGEILRIHGPIYWQDVTSQNLGGFLENDEPEDLEWANEILWRTTKPNE